MNGKQVIKFLKLHGWELKAVMGSHHQMVNQKGRKTSVPVHGSKDLKKKTIIGIEKQTGVKLR